MKIPFDRSCLRSALERMDIADIAQATIRQSGDIARTMERDTGVEFLHLEMGVPGLPPERAGVEAECAALQAGVASQYPNMFGIPELKTQASRFLKAFLDVEVAPRGCIPTVGSMQGSFTTFLLCSQLDPQRRKILFIDPGFPVQKQQIAVMGYKYESFDVYEYRGERLREALETHLSKGNIAAMIYSNPNNPAWFCLTDEELKIIGEMANKYDVIVIEDLAYFAMDFRKDLSHPGKAPFQPTVAKYTDNYIFMISSSKLFSYAGQRLGLLCISDALFHKKYEHLKERYKADKLGYTITYKLIYTQTSGTAHSPQYAVAAVLKAANEGRINILTDVREYGKRAEIMKTLYKNAGFKVVYDKDGHEDVADGFYFTIYYPGMTGAELAKELLYYGISSITLKGCGSTREGLRACVSQVGLDQMDTLKDRIERFAKDHTPTEL